MPRAARTRRRLAFSSRNRWFSSSRCSNETDSELLLAISGSPLHTAYQNVFEELAHVVEDRSDVRLQGRSMVVVIAAVLFEIAEERFRIGVAPVSEENCIFSVAIERLFLSRFNNKRTEKPGLLLEVRVAVIPIGSALPYRKTVNKRRPRSDAGETKAGNAIHLRGNAQTVPVNRGGFFQFVGHGHRNGVALTPSQGWPRNRSVDRSGHDAASRKVHRRGVDRKLKMVAAESYRRLRDDSFGGAYIFGDQSGSSTGKSCAMNDLPPAQPVAP